MIKNIAVSIIFILCFFISACGKMLEESKIEEVSATVTTVRKMGVSQYYRHRECMFIAKVEKTNDLIKFSPRQAMIGISHTYYNGYDLNIAEDCLFLEEGDKIFITKVIDAKNNVSYRWWRNNVAGEIIPK